MKDAISVALGGALFLVSAAAQAGYQSCGSQVVADNVSSCPDGTIPSYHAGQIAAPAPQAPNAQPGQSQTVQPYRSRSEPHLFTRQERDEMLRNDDNAGRTHKSMSKGSGARAATGSSDPYNSGGWNYDRNQPAPAIWNPNRQ